MKIAVDTNVLVRLVTGDDPRQNTAAMTAVQGADIVQISTIVLSELVWVLRRAYRYSDGDIIDVVRRLLQSRNIEADIMAAEAGLRMLSRGGDFADGVIQFE